MQTITITLDGREVSGYAGMTILELARESGIDIPTLCDDPSLVPIGACRLCLVEEENSGALLASCVAPIASGMVINTRSPRVLERRKTLVELMLASHPDSCLVCDKGNRCQLRKIASDMGIGLVRLQRIPQTATIDEVNPFIERDLSKCILCAKCIRADQELVVEGAIDYFRRGFTAKPATLSDLPLERSDCTFCGTCVALCPTGALTEKEKAYRGTTTTTVETVCPFCGCGCGIGLEVKDNHIVRVRPAQGDSVNRNTLCVGGSYGLDFIHSSERLTSPLVKVNGSFETVSWEKALETVATQLKLIMEEHGAGSVAVLGSSKCTNEENYLLQRFARGVLGTNNIDNGSRLCGSALVALGQTVGFAATSTPLNGIERSEVILVIGADPTVAAPVVGYAIKRAVKYKGAQLLLIDPRQTKLASFAHLHLRPKVGTDVAFINALARVIVDEKLLDEEYVLRRTDNFEALAEVLNKYDPEEVAKITGVSREMIRRAARLLAGASQASIVYGNGITQHANATDGVMALANLAMLTGNVRGRGGIYTLQRENNGRGALEMGANPHFLPGYQSIEDARARENYEKRWQVRLPDNLGLTALEMIDCIEKGEIKGMYIVGENPALSFPHQSLVKEALTSLQFLVVQDIFLTETAKLAKVVLPAASFAEKEGTFTNFEGRVQRLQKAIEPPGKSLPDWEIILRLAGSMGSPMPYLSLQQVMDEIEELVPFYRSMARGSLRLANSDWSELSESSGVRGIPARQFPGGFARFSPVHYTAQSGTSREEYPFTLLTGSILYRFGTGSRSSRSSKLQKFLPEAFVEVAEPDARQLGISNGDRVKLSSPVGELTTTARITGSLPEGTLFMPMSFPESPVNVLFDLALDRQTKIPSLKACAVRIEGVVTHE